MSKADQKTGKALADLIASSGLTFRDFERRSGYYRGHTLEVVKGLRPWASVPHQVQERFATALGMTLKQLDDALAEAVAPVVEAPKVVPLAKAKRKRTSPGPEMTTERPPPGDIA